LLEKYAASSHGRTATSQFGGPDCAVLEEFINDRMQTIRIRTKTPIMDIVIVCEIDGFSVFSFAIPISYAIKSPIQTKGTPRMEG